MAAFGSGRKARFTDSLYFRLDFSPDRLAISPSIVPRGQYIYRGERPTPSSTLPSASTPIFENSSRSFFSRATRRLSRVFEKIYNPAIIGRIVIASIVVEIRELLRSYIAISRIVAFLKSVGGDRGGIDRWIEDGRH